MLNADVLFFRHLAKNVAEVKRNRSGKMNLQLFVSLVLHYVLFKKFFEAASHQLMAIRLVEMLKNKMCEAPQKAAGHFLVINAIQKLFSLKWESLLKLIP